MTDNQAEFMQGMESLMKALDQAAQQTVIDVGQKAVEVARNTTAFHNILKDKTHFESSGSYAGEVLDDREYAYYLEYGNDPGGGRIYPRQAKALRFVLNGQVVFAKSVRAHGPYRFVETGRDVAESEIETIFQNNFKF